MFDENWLVGLTSEGDSVAGFAFSRASALKVESPWNPAADLSTSLREKRFFGGSLDEVPSLLCASGATSSLPRKMGGSFHFVVLPLRLTDDGD